MYSSDGGAGGGTVGISIGAVAVGIPSSRRGSIVGPVCTPANEEKMK